MVAVVRKPTRVRGLHHLEPLRGVDLVGAELGADLVVEDLGRGAGQRAEAGLLQAAQEVSSETPSVAAPCHTSSGEKACTCMSGAASFTARQMSR